MKPITIKFTISPQEIKGCAARQTTGCPSVHEKDGPASLIAEAIELIKTRLRNFARDSAQCHLNKFLNGREGHAMIASLMTETVAETLNPPKKRKPAKKAA